MPHVVIFQRPKSATQSGRALTQRWMMTFPAQHASVQDPVMGWVGSQDMMDEVTLTFNSQEEALAFAQKNGFTYEVRVMRQEITRPKSYGQNFASDRLRNTIRLP